MLRHVSASPTAAWASSGSRIVWSTASAWFTCSRQARSTFSPADGSLPSALLLKAAPASTRAMRSTSGRLDSGIGEPPVRGDQPAQPSSVSAAGSPAILRAAWTSSTGSIAMIVLLCSTPISVSVCSRLNSRRHPVLDGSHDVNRRIRAEPQDGIHPDGDAVPSDRFLGFELVGDGPHVDADDPVDVRDQPVPTWPFHWSQASQAEQHAALIFLVDAEALQRADQQEEQEDAKDYIGGNHRHLLRYRLLITPRTAQPRPCRRRRTSSPRHISRRGA